MKGKAEERLSHEKLVRWSEIDQFKEIQLCISLVDIEISATGRRLQLIF